MRPNITCLLSVALAAISAKGQSVEYHYDDGSGGNAGPNAVGWFVWGNVFDVSGEASEITTLRIAAGRPAAGGSTLTALLFEDPNDDGNPDDGVLLRSVEFTPAVISSNTFTEVPVAPVRVSGRFFVACAARVDGTTAARPARTDFQTGLAFGTNTFFYWGSELDPATLTGWSNRAQYTGVATVMVRAIGRAATCRADIGSIGGTASPDGLLNNNDFIVFIDWFFSQDPRADIGTTGGAPAGDGLYDNNDFVVFIERFFAGC